LPLAAVLIGMLVLSMLREAEEWESFSERRKCRVVGYMRGNKSWPKDRETKTVLPSTPDGPHDLKTGYACDDGFTYWR
jgi:hypothetical protein